MGADRLSRFFDEVVSWPRSSLEVSGVADHLLRLVDAKGSVISLPGVGIGSAGFDGVANFGAEACLEQLRKAMPEMSTPDGVRQVRLSSQCPAQHFCVVSLPLSGPETAGVGWVVTGSAKPTGSESLIALLAASRHLLGLARLEQARRDLMLRDQFLSIASHELKTPLTSIYGVLQLQERMLRLKKDPRTPDEEKQLSFFRIVLRQVERLNELIDGLLNVSRIQLGRFMVEPSEVDVAALLHETVTSRLNVIAQDAAVKIQLEAPSALTALVDPIRFEEVVTNLGMNAIRFSPEGGVVWMRLKEADGSFVLSVRDQGPAVPEQDRSRIFQPFERAQRTSRLGGLGLGLFIARQIAQLHGGDVRLAESLPGKGNLFEAVFPIRPDQKEARKSA